MDAGLDTGHFIKFLPALGDYRIINYYDVDSAVYGQSRIDRGGVAEFLLEVMTSGNKPKSNGLGGRILFNRNRNASGMVS